MCLHYSGTAGWHAVQDLQHCKPGQSRAPCMTAVVCCCTTEGSSRPWSGSDETADMGRLWFMSPLRR